MHLFCKIHTFRVISDQILSFSTEVRVKSTFLIDFLQKPINRHLIKNWNNKIVALKKINYMFFF